MCWVFVSVLGLSPVAASRGHSSSRCAGLSLSRPLVAEHMLQTRRLSSCGSRAHLLRGMWDLPRPGLEPASPALAGRFSTTAPPGKPNALAILKLFSNKQSVWHQGYLGISLSCSPLSQVLVCLVLLRHHCPSPYFSCQNPERVCSIFLPLHPHGK